MRVILFLSVLWLPHNVLAKPTTLLDAVKQGSIFLNIGKSSYQEAHQQTDTPRCLRLEIWNREEVEQTIVVESGYRFQNLTSPHQDLINIEPITVRLKVHQRDTVFLNAHCCERHDNSPAGSDQFKLLYRFKGPMVKLIDSLYKLNCFQDFAQQSIWCVSDSNCPANLMQFNEDKWVAPFVKWLAKEMHHSEDHHEHGCPHLAHNGKYHALVKGDITIRVKECSDMAIYLTDRNDVIIETLIVDPNRRCSGSGTYSWEKDVQLPSGYYVVQLLKNKEWYKISDFNISSTGPFTMYSEAEINPKN